MAATLPARTRGGPLGCDDGDVNAHPGTVLDAIRLLEAEGFGASFVFTDGALRCGVCGDAHRTEGAMVAAVYRFEGPSDPEEEAVVYAVRCPSCDAGGSIVSAYGPGADPAMTDRLVMLDSRFVDRPGS